ncbi:MAG: Y4bD/Y4pK family protein [Candidatus Eisenbacteria bacterium]|nr:Y4bD/Y4pK family protein [Candidatus Eisenbacteria bacterium]
MCVTHPFHPLSGQRFVCVGERYNRYGTRLLLDVDDDIVCSVPRQWTDRVAPDPEVVFGEGRALFRVGDLLKLTQLVARLGGHASVETSDEV